jgi:hypothetical protein
VSDWDDEWEEDDKWEDESPSEGASGFAVPSDVMRSVTLGFLACLPLWIAYEVALSHAGEGWRGTAEILVLRGLEPLSEHITLIRRSLLLVLTVAAGIAFARRQQGALPSLLRVIGEGTLAAVLLGPILVGLLHLSGVGADALPPAPSTVPPGSMGLLVLGAGAWEELVFRALVYGGLYVLTLHLARFMGTPAKVDRTIAEVIALVGQAGLFAAAHVASFVEPFGAYGEPFDAAAFPYRVLAGILLGLLFRWRGLGVAAWAHGLFNLALLLGAGPQVFS